MRSWIRIFPQIIFWQGGIKNAFHWIPVRAWILLSLGAVHGTPSTNTPEQGLTRQTILGISYSKTVLVAIAANNEIASSYSKQILIYNLWYNILYMYVYIYISYCLPVLYSSQSEASQHTTQANACQFQDCATRQGAGQATHLGGLRPEMEVVSAYGNMLAWDRCIIQHRLHWNVGCLKKKCQMEFILFRW